jgi:phage baseplate assembly protein W
MAAYDASSTNKSKKTVRSFYKDLDLDFTRNVVTNDVVKIEDVNAVKRSVRNLVQTNFYERPFHPELGCGVRELLFENFTPLTRIFLQRKIEEVITNYEPRASLEQVAVDDDQDKNRLVVDIYFYVQGVADPVSVTTFLQRLR